MESKAFSEESTANLASSGYNCAPKRNYIHNSKIGKEIN